MTIDLRIDDTNDNSPRFTSAVYNASLPENSERGSVVVVARAYDADEGQNGRVRYAISKNSEVRYPGMFQMNWETGALILWGRLDREHQATYIVAISATDLGDSPVPAQATVVVTVTDVNDNRPEMSVEYLTGRDQLTAVSENADPGTLVASMSVSDVDDGDAGRVECTLGGGGGGGGVLTLAAQASGKEFRVLTARRLDRSVDEHSVNVTIFCRDFGRPQLTSTVNLAVIIVDAEADRRRPRFTDAVYEASLVENNRPGAFVVNVSLVDADETLDWVYSLPRSVAGSFRIDPRTGVVTAARSFDREELDCLEFNVTAEEDEDADSKASASKASILRTSALRTSALVRVLIVDADDEFPRFDRTASYEFEVAENVPVGTRVGRVEATDRDLYPFNETWYALDRLSIQDDSGDLEINADTGIIFTRRGLDREARDRYSLIALAHSRTSGTTRCDSVRVSVLVLDSNDNRPVIAYPTSGNNTLVVVVPPGGSPGKVIGVIVARDGDADDNGILRYRFSNQSSYFDVVPETGQVFLKRIPPENSSHLLQVVVTDSGVPALTSSATLQVLVLDGRKAAPPPPPPANTEPMSGAFRQDVVLVFAGIVAGCVLLLAAVVATCIHLGQRVRIWRRRRRRRTKADRKRDAIWSVVRALSGGSGTTSDDSGSRIIPKLDFEPVNFEFRHRRVPVSDGVDCEDSGLDLTTIGAEAGQGSCVEEDDDSEPNGRRPPATSRSSSSVLPASSGTPNHFMHLNPTKLKKDDFPFPPPPPVSLPYSPDREFYVNEKQTDGTSSFRPLRLPRSCSVDCDGSLCSTMPPEGRQGCLQQRPSVLPSLFQGRGHCCDVCDAETRVSLPRSASYGSRKSVRFAAEDR